MPIGTALQKEKKVKMKKILFINQEITPYVPENEMSIMGRELPQSMLELGNEVRTFMPKWGTINERRGQLHEVIRLSGLNIVVNETDHPLIIKVASIPSTRLQVYFIDNDEFFMKRRMNADEHGDDYVDNGERAIFFARGVLETVKKLRWTPDIVHCSGWMTAIIPYYLRTAFKDEPAYANVKIVTYLHGKSIHSDFGDNFVELIDYKGTKNKALETYARPFDSKQLGKLSIDYSDAVICAQKTTSPELMKYAKDQGKAVLNFTDEHVAEKIAQFYESL